VPTIANAGHFYQIGLDRVKNFSGKICDFSSKARPLLEYNDSIDGRRIKRLVRVIAVSGGKVTKLTVDQLILNSCRQYPDRIAFRSKVAGRWHETSFRNLHSTVHRLSIGLSASGSKPGQHAAIIAAPSYRWVAAYLAVLHCGGVVVPIDKELKATELRHVLNDSDARMLLTKNPYVDLLQDVVSELPQLERIILLDDSVHGDAPETPVSELRDAWQQLVRDLDLPREKTQPIESLAARIFQQLGGKLAPESADKAATLLGPGAKHLANWVRKGRVQSFSQLLQTEGQMQTPHASADLPAVILYTSGTTGQAKGAMLSHENITFNIDAAIQHLGLGDGITTLSFLPINHVFEQVCGILLPLSTGGTISFAESLKKIGENLAEIKPTFLLGVPAVYRLLLDRIMKNIQASLLSRLLFRFPLTRPIIQAKIRKKSA